MIIQKCVIRQQFTTAGIQRRIELSKENLIYPYTKNNGYVIIYIDNYIVTPIVTEGKT